jgi:DNA-directed RNA polymerase subunit beta'
VRRLGYLKAAEKTGVHPSEWVVARVPVLPPLFRPVSMMQDGKLLVSDANYLYKEVFDANKALKDLDGRVDDVGEERVNLYKAFKAVAGLGDPIQPKNVERGVKGLLAQVFGDSPKFGTVQQKLLGNSLDLVGRAVVVPNPDLSMDEVGLPEGRAWEVYSPFLIRRLVRKGVGRVQALQYVKDRSPLARKALIEEMDERPVLVNRAPVLHRYGLMAFYPRIVRGDVLQVSPLITTGMGMDFDGDTSNYQPVADDDAAKEAFLKMLPSRNLLAVSSFKKPVYVPKREYQAGLWRATASVGKDKKARTFANSKAALQAYERGELDPDDPVEVLEP